MQKANKRNMLTRFFVNLDAKSGARKFVRGLVCGFVITIALPAVSAEPTFTQCFREKVIPPCDQWKISQEYCRSFKSKFFLDESRGCYGQRWSMPKGFYSNKYIAYHPMTETLILTVGRPGLVPEITKLTPGRELPKRTPSLYKEVKVRALFIENFEQRVQRPPHNNSHFSGKKKQNTLKSQVIVDGQSGRIVATSSSVVGPTPDLTLLKQSGMLARLPLGCGVVGDLGYLGMDKLHPLAFIPRRKPRGKPHPAEDQPYNIAFAAFRVIVEHTIGRMRRFQCLNQMDRHHRLHHAARVAAVAGLVNRQPIFATA